MEGFIKRNTYGSERLNQVLAAEIAFVFEPVLVGQSSHPQNQPSRCSAEWFHP